MSDYRICTQCVMDTTDPAIFFDAHGVCNHCHAFASILKDTPSLLTGDPALLESTVAAIKERGKDRPYDCLLGLSGGIDSSYLAYQVKKLGLRPLVLHVDNGWDSAIALSNIERLVTTLHLDLVTHVLDWDAFRDLQIAFLRASVSDAEIPTDHAIAACTYKTAAEWNIPTIISGTNKVTEAILPFRWTYGVRDWRYIRSVHQQFGTRSIRSYPRYRYTDLWWHRHMQNRETIRLLDLLPYRKQEATQQLMRECGWQSYGGKHCESIYTRFFQGYILPRKFGIDKRRAHYATLIASGQLSRFDALQALEHPAYTDKDAEADRAYVCSKFNLSHDAFEDIMQLPVRRHTDFTSYATPTVLQSAVDRFLRTCGIGFPEHIDL